MKVSNSGDKIGGSLSLWENNAFNSFSGLENITEINKSLFISNCPLLHNFDGFEKLQSIGGNLIISSNNGLNNLSGLEQLNTIMGDLKIFNNPTLDSVTSFKQLNNVAGEISISHNNHLTSLSGLDNIEPDSLKGCYLINNPVLTTCAIESICAYLLKPNAVVIIDNNATGCMNQEEVEANCQTLEIRPFNTDYGFSFFPNPATDNIFILNKNDKKILEICIYNQLGQKVFSQTEPNNSLNIAHLKEGLHIIEIIGGDFCWKGKLLIQK
jgi:type IX secretion system substrate protein